MAQVEGEVTLQLQEQIGFDGVSGMSARVFGSVLGGIPRAKPVMLEINTMGGNVPEGTAIANMISARGNVTTRVIGYAASMGVSIFQAGARREMMPGTMLIVHNPMGSNSGDSASMKNQAVILAQVKESLVGVLASRTKLPADVISKMMDATTAIDPQTALDTGWCDCIVEGVAATNHFDLVAFFNSNRLQSAVGSGEPAKERNKMKNIVSVLAGLHLVNSADITEEAVVVTQLEASVPAIIAERNQLKLANDKHVEAAKSRITNRVELAITNKLIKAERKDSLIASGISNEASLDFIDDLYASQREAATAAATAAASATPARRGALPVPATPDAGVDALASIRNQMAIETDPAKIAEFALKARDLRGHKELFAAPASK